MNWIVLIATHSAAELTASSGKVVYAQETEAENSCTELKERRVVL